MTGHPADGIAPNREKTARIRLGAKGYTLFYGWASRRRLENHFGSLPLARYALIYSGAKDYQKTETVFAFLLAGIDETRNNTVPTVADLETLLDGVPMVDGEEVLKVATDIAWELAAVSFGWNKASGDDEGEAGAAVEAAAVSGLQPTGDVSTDGAPPSEA